MSDAKGVNLIFLRGFRRNKKYLKEGFFLLNLKGLRALAKAIGIKYYYRMSRVQLENIIVRKCVFHINPLKAVFVQAKADSHVISTFSFRTENIMTSKILSCLMSFSMLMRTEIISSLGAKILQYEMTLWGLISDCCTPKIMRESSRMNALMMKVFSTRSFWIYAITFKECITYSDINENDALNYNEAINALCNVALKYDVHSNLNRIFLSHHSALDDDLLMSSKNAPIIPYVRLHSTIPHLFMSVLVLEENIAFPQDKVKYKVWHTLLEWLPQVFWQNA